MRNAEFVSEIKKQIENGKKHTKISIEKIARTFEITDKNLTKELTELAIVLLAREIAHRPEPLRIRYDAIVELYKRQPVLSQRTSKSVKFQQFSTPAPIAFLAGTYCNFDKTGNYFEPSAGNGMLTIAGDAGDFVVNELDPTRLVNLQTQGYRFVIQGDATKDFEIEHRFSRNFDAIITNPPFGKLPEKIEFSKFPISSLEQLMAIRALDTMRNDGKGAIIIGGHTKWDDRGRIQAGKNRIFFNYLNHFYNVDDVINIDGSLYARMGTSFPVRLILINGRKAVPAGAAPLRSKNDKTVISFNELYKKIVPQITTQSENILELEALALSNELELLNLGAPYVPSAAACTVLNTEVPDSMAFETGFALEKITKDVGGDMQNFVRDRLGYATNLDLCDVLAAEQVDAVGMEIYNIEAKGQGMIIGDQTGIGKGRQAAGVIVYAIKQGLKPIFLTQAPHLFSDLYRDRSEEHTSELQSH